MEAGMNVVNVELNIVLKHKEWNYVIPTNDMVDEYVYCYVFNHNDFNGHITYMYGQYFPVNDINKYHTIGWCMDSEIDTLKDLNFYECIEKRLDIV